VSKNPEYSDVFKDEVLATYVEKGPAEASRVHGIPTRTIGRWAKRAGAVPKDTTKMVAAAARMAVNTRRMVVREKLLCRVEEALDRMNESHTAYVGKDATPVELDKPPASVCKDLAYVVGILLDKFRLEVGDVTGREEVRHDYANRSDASLIEEAEAILRAAADR
jgi:transposase-like protein